MTGSYFYENTKNRIYNIVQHIELTDYQTIACKNTIYKEKNKAYDKYQEKESTSQAKKRFAIYT